MSATCEAAAESVTRALGFSCEDRNPVLSLRNPFDLHHGSMPFLELLIVAGAVWAFVHAWRRWRIDGDPVNLGLWIASLAYLAIIEPPLYFPTWFGLEEHVGFIFSHNLFTVNLMYDRLPLYIVAFYPAISQLAYEVVRAFGIAARRGAVAAGFAVAFTCQVFYEIFDHLGPQLTWWGWNPDNRMINQPALDSVPMNSMLMFASVSFGALTWLMLRFVGTATPRSGGSLFWRSVAAGVLTPLAMIIVSAPSGAFRGENQLGIQETILWVELGVVWAVGLWLLVDAWRAAPPATPIARPSFALGYPALFLAVHAVLWAFALPAYLDATDGRTTSGTPVGSLPYVLACFVASIALIAATVRAVRAAGPRETAPMAA